MESHDVGPPEQPEPHHKTDQEIFDEQVARGTGKAVLITAAVAIVAALVMSFVALVNSGNTTTVSVAAPPVTVTKAAPAALTGDALGKQIFVSGVPSQSLMACAACHTMAAAGATGTLGPNLDKELTADPASATRESIVDPNKEIATGYRPDIMPKNYGAALTNQQLDAVVQYVYDSTNLKAKAKAKSTTGTTTTP